MASHNTEEWEKPSASSAIANTCINSSVGNSGVSDEERAIFITLISAVKADSVSLVVPSLRHNTVLSMSIVPCVIAGVKSQLLRTSAREVYRLSFLSVHTVFHHNVGEKRHVDGEGDYDEAELFLNR